MFQKPPERMDFVALERHVMAFWREHDIQNKHIDLRAGQRPYVFYEGPPTANGLPHPGHVLTRVMKDLYPRYKTMCGYHCERKGGWDTHGLPVEVEVCKELGIHSKEEIESYGVEPFIRRCIESVFRYVKDWEALTERIAFWLDLPNAYVTYHQSYIESVWWALKTLFDRGLLYQGHKIVWWWAQGGTALSSGEVGLGYREVDDPSVYVKCPVVGEKRLALLVWTTTPWTLPDNLFVAVRADFDYAVVRDEVEDVELIIAADLVETIAGKLKRELPVVRTMKGRDLVGMRYVPPFDFHYATLGNATLPLKSGGEAHVYWRVHGADFVTLDAGTGLVHQAPAYGEVDYELFKTNAAQFAEPEGIELICSVKPNGRFRESIGPYAGMWVKNADKQILRDLRDNGRLYHQELYRHDYPFCWRAEQDPLLQYPRKSWFIRTTQFVDKMLANNNAVGWYPDHIRTGRFGKFLESNVDWALSRERFWGTPLPIWQCDKTGFQEAIASYEELLAKPGVDGTDMWESAKRETPTLSDDLRVHKPYIDEITYQSPKDPAARMRRVPEVIDCWFDSGCMPFAQFGFPHQNPKKFDSQFPADFICEAIDQTRGWFYSQLAISTLLFGDERAEAWLPKRDWPHPYRNCLVLGLVLGNDGQKLSKSKRNYDEPGKILEREGADAMRWYFYSAQAPWTSTRFDESAIATAQREFLIRLYNVYSFFLIYANIDSFTPAGRGVPSDKDHARSELDRWILSELSMTVRDVRRHMDAYDNYAAARVLIDFVDGLSNWYVRRSRDRFWRGGMDADKRAAYQTLWHCLVTTAEMIAPFCPFFAEEIYQKLVRSCVNDAPESVHLCDYPQPDDGHLDDALSAGMRIAREIASLGRAARVTAKLKVRQPLDLVELVLGDRGQEKWVEAHADLITDELNVKRLEFAHQPERYVDYEIKPNFRAIGPKFGKLAPGIKKVLAKADAAKLRAELDDHEKTTISVDGEVVDLTPDDVQVHVSAKPGWTAAQGRGAVVILSTEITEDLKLEGVARELIHHIQQIRKDLNLEYTDRIRLHVAAEGDVTAVCERFGESIRHETLAEALETRDGAGEPNADVSIDGNAARIWVNKA